MNRSAHRLALAAASVSVSAALACAHGPSAPPPLAPDAVDLAAPDFRIGPEDVLEIAVWQNDAVSRLVPVRPDGFITLPLINDVMAAGLTPMELRAELAKKLAVYLPSPVVAVIVREVHSAKVSVLGEVVHPGTYELRGPSTLLELLAHAGGLTPFASRSKIVVIRARGAATERIVVDESEALEDPRRENVLLETGDLIFVP